LFEYYTPGFYLVMSKYQNEHFVTKYTHAADLIKVKIFQKCPKNVPHVTNEVTF